jgi:hypothetical protein
MARAPVRLVLAFEALASASAVAAGLPPLIVEISSQNPSCSDSCDGSATAIVSGGLAPYTYSWSPTGGAGSTATGLCGGGPYTVTVTDENLSQATAQASLLAPPALLAGGSKTDATSTFACDGTASVSPTGGTGSDAVSWSPGGSTATSLAGLCPGTYVATVTDLNNCTALYTANVGAPVTPPTSFHTLTPCRLADTRGPAGPYGAPGIAAGGTRHFDVPAASCGVPPTARAVALNVTVVAAAAAGTLVVTAGDQVSTATSTLSFAAGQTRASNAIAGLSSAGDVAVTSTAPSLVNVVLDVSGYFE